MTKRKLKNPMMLITSDKYLFIESLFVACQDIFRRVLSASSLEKLNPLLWQVKCVGLVQLGD
jgi:hypothetical protein